MKFSRLYWGDVKVHSETLYLDSKYMTCFQKTNQNFKLSRHEWGEVRLLPAVSDVASKLLLLLKLLKLKNDVFHDISKNFIKQKKIPMFLN